MLVETMKTMSSFFFEYQSSSQSYTIKYIASTSDCVSDFASFKRTKKNFIFTKAWKWLDILVSLFYLILGTDTRVIFMRNKG